MSSLSKITSVIVAIIILIFAPLTYVATKQDQISQIYVYDCTVKLVDMIRNNGYLTEESYNLYLKKLNVTGNIYDIKITHKHQEYNPIYDVNTYEFTGDYSVNERCIYTEDIINEIYQGKKVYYFSQDDYISITVNNINESFGGRMHRLFLRTEKKGSQIYVTYGGMVRDENY